MDEVAFYVTEGDPNDKHSKESLGVAASVHKSLTFATFRNADCPRHGAAVTGMGSGERLFVAGKDKALINCYIWGKEGVDQKFPVPETMSCLAVVQTPNVAVEGKIVRKAPFDPPWLLIAGSKTGKLYVWEVASGNLMHVKDAHYQEISCIRVSQCGSFIVTGGLDARVMVWRTLDLVSAGGESAAPYASFTNHSLPITDIAIADSNIPSDINVYTSSKDCTVRLYNIVTKTLMTTFVFDSPIECIARDAADRAIFAGLSDGTIRQVPLYVINPQNRQLENVVATGKVVTVSPDPELRETFVYHKNESLCVPTVIRMSFDGMSIISGDSQGRVIVGDVVTKQVMKAFTPCKSAIAFLQVEAHTDNVLRNGVLEKNHQLLQTLKRSKFSGDLNDHNVVLQLPEEDEIPPTREEWLQTVLEEDMEFSRLAEEEEKVKAKLQDTEKVKSLEQKLLKVSEAYNSLRSMYEDLYKEYHK